MLLAVWALSSFKCVPVASCLLFWFFIVFLFCEYVLGPDVFLAGSFSLSSNSSSDGDSSLGGSSDIGSGAGFFGFGVILVLGAIL